MHKYQYSLRYCTLSLVLRQMDQACFLTLFQLSIRMLLDPYITGYQASSVHQSEDEPLLLAVRFAGAAGESGTTHRGIRRERSITSAIPYG